MVFIALNLLCSWLSSVSCEDEEAGCQIQNNGLSYYCNFNGRTMHFDIDFELCKEPAKVLVVIDIQALNMYHQEEYESSVEIPIPAFGFNSYIRIQFERDANKTVDFKLEVAISGLPTFTILKRKVPPPDCNSLGLWFKSLSTGSLVALAVGLMLILMAVVWICICCCRERRRSAVSTIITNSGIYVSFPIVD